MDVVFKTLIDIWLWDVNILRTELWLYYWACIPAFFFVVFMALQWMVLLMPVWLPLSWIFNAFRSK